MRVLGLDVALSTGWSLIDEDGVEAYGALTIRGKDMKRYGNAAKLYRELFERTQPDVAYYEDVKFAKYRLAYTSFCRLSTVLFLVCHDLQIPCYGVDTTTLKKFWADKGNATKSDMCEACARHVGVELAPRDAKWGSKAQEDMADAIAVAMYGYREVTSSVCA